MKLSTSRVLTWWSTAEESEDTAAACSGRLSCDTITAVEEDASSSGNLYGFVVATRQVSTTGSFRRRLSSQSPGEIESKACFACSRLQDREQWIAALRRILVSGGAGGVVAE